MGWFWQAFKPQSLNIVGVLTWTKWPQACTLKVQTNVAMGTIQTNKNGGSGLWMTYYYELWLTIFDITCASNMKLVG